MHQVRSLSGPWVRTGHAGQDWASVHWPKMRKMNKDEWMSCRCAPGISLCFSSRYCEKLWEWILDWSFFVFSFKCSLFLLSIALDLAQLKSEADDSKRDLQKVLYIVRKKVRNILICSLRLFYLKHFHFIWLQLTGEHEQLKMQLNLERKSGREKVRFFTFVKGLFNLN